MGGGQAFALSITSASCSVQPGNALRFDCTVVTDAPSNVYIKFGQDTGAGCQQLRETRTSSDAASHDLVVYGMKPETDYEWRAYAQPSSGGAWVSTACQTESTEALPSGGGTGGLAELVISTSGAADQVHNFEDCDTEDEYPLIVDGVYGFDVSAAPSLEVDWDWLDVDAGMVNYSEVSPPNCGYGGYWGGDAR